jgi:hypothetical protein
MPTEPGQWEFGSLDTERTSSVGHMIHVSDCPYSGIRYKGAHNNYPQ